MFKTINNNCIFHYVMYTQPGILLFAPKPAIYLLLVSHHFLCLWATTNKLHVITKCNETINKSVVYCVRNTNIYYLIRGAKKKHTQYKSVFILSTVYKKECLICWKRTRQFPNIANIFLGSRAERNLKC